ncbi:MAG: DUF4832 domain-containing protein [Treponema sp.]|nr:DUF4832 domain-containing protein [Treponema sp.]
MKNVCKLVGVALVCSVFFLMPCCSSDGGGDDGNNGTVSTDRTLAVNPLKGFICWEDKKTDLCSLEFVQIKFNEVLTANKSCDFSVLEQKLKAAKARRRQAVVRIVIEIPDDGLYLPSFLNSVPRYSYAKGTTPNYNNATLLEQILYVIEQFGSKYDGDPRIALVQTGMLGHWGEQHTTYLSSNHPGRINDETYEKFFKTFAKSFTKTLIAAGAPNRPGAISYPSIGFYHDTLYADAEDQDYRNRLNKVSGWSRWQTSMITGEIASGEKGRLCSNSGDEAVFSKFKSRMSEFHVSSCLFNRIFSSSANRTNILIYSSYLGYNFVPKVNAVSASGKSVSVSLSLQNNGCAPFYYDWPAYIAIAKGGSIVEKHSASAVKIHSVNPGETKAFSVTKDFSKDPSGCTVLLAVPNKMDGGYPVSFDSAQMNRDVSGWLSVGSL